MTYFTIGKFSWKIGDSNYNFPGPVRIFTVKENHISPAVIHPVTFI